MRLVAVAAALAILVVAPGAATFADERSAPEIMADRLSVAPQPGRNPLDLAVRLRGVSPGTPLIAPAAPAPLSTGVSQSFWVLDQRSAQLFQSAATLRLVTDHAYWFVQSDMADRVSQSDLERSANIFETRTYPLMHRYFGSEPNPAVDGGDHIVFLLANVPGVAAYFSSADAFPRSVNPRSNEHSMIYVNLNALRPGQASFDSTLTHEFQHMTSFGRCPAQEGWLDEGASELAMRLAGYEIPPPIAFAAHPDIQLTTWAGANQAADQTRHYQASYLFLRYLVARAGGWDVLPDLFASCARGEAMLNLFLTRYPVAPDLNSLFSDWTVANLLQDTSAADGRYAYENGGFHAAATGVLSRKAPFLGSVPQYAANYVNLPIGPGSVVFNGDSSVALVGAPIDAGGAWWSNRGDNLDSRLTRQLDLTDVEDATLRFKVWYDTEDQFDFVYLSASPDNGRTWQVLPGLHTVADHSTGNNYGPGWTGSIADWVDEEVDLSAFVGSQILLRFEYVTDQSYNGQGFALKDVRIPQLGVDEPGAAEGPWSAEGWVRVDAPIPEHWNLRVVEWTREGVNVSALPVDASGSTTIPLDDAAIRSTLVIAPTAPRTLVPANYSVTATP
jgi:immune inhibitor A